MNTKRNRLILAVGLVILSSALYYFHYMVFHDAHHIFIYLIGDIAFLPLELVFVSLIFHQIIEDREKLKTVRKVNMLIGDFFSQIGNELFVLLIRSDNHVSALKETLLITNDWTKKNFKQAYQVVDRYTASFAQVDLNGLKALLDQNKDCIHKLLENPVLLGGNPKFCVNLRCGVE